MTELGQAGVLEIAEKFPKAPEKETVMPTAAKTKGRKGRKAPPTPIVEREAPRAVPDGELGTKALRVPENPLDAFIVHEPGSFDLGDAVWTPQLTNGQWKAAQLLIERGYVLGMCCTPEEAVVLAACVSRKLREHVLFAYDETEEMVWVTRA